MKTRSRRQQPTSSSSSTSSATSAQGAGNQARSWLLAGEGSGESEEENDHHLQYRTTTEDGEDRDPEQRDGTLPFTDDGWDVTAILNNLTQVDDDDLTITDSIRCAAVSTLATHVRGGPDSVAAVARDTWSTMITQDFLSFINGIPDATEANLQALTEVIRGLPGRLDDGTATYQDLRRLSHCMKLTVDWDPTSGTSSDEYSGLTGIGDALSAYVGQTYTGFSAADDLVDYLESIGGMIELTGAKVGLILAVGTNDSQPGRTNHAVNLSLDASGNAELFDPWPKDGDQLMQWSSDESQIKPYFETTSGTDRTWRVRSIMSAA